MSGQSRVEKWILPVALGGLFVFFTGAISLTCMMNSCTQEKEARREAEIKAKFEAKAKAQWDAMSPEQHKQAFLDALAKKDFPLCDKHLPAVPPEDAPALKKRLVSAVETSRQERAKAKATAEKAHMEGPGEKPDPAVLSIALRRSIKEVAHDPDSVSDVEVYEPTPAKLGKVGCWKTNFMFRARNGFGALRMTRGTVWYKDGAILKSITD